MGLRPFVNLESARNRKTSCFCSAVPQEGAREGGWALHAGSETVSPESIVREPTHGLFAREIARERPAFFHIETDSTGVIRGIARKTSNFPRS